MFGSNSPSSSPDTLPAPAPVDEAAVPPSPTEKHHRGGSGKASALFASARNSLSSLGTSFGGGSSSHKDSDEKPTKQSKTEAKAVANAAHNNSAGDSRPGPTSTFRVGVTEDRNKKCRRTMEDTHSYLYNFMSGTPEATSNSSSTVSTDDSSSTFVGDTDNGYFAIFDGHAGAYAADWCGKRLHLVLEEVIRKNPNTPIPELLDLTFTSCDSQLEKLPMRNSGCTAVCALLRWEDRISRLSPDSQASEKTSGQATPAYERQRILYTANVGDARIILCRGGKAKRLSYDHKGNDENESRRVSNAGGLILNNRVNGVLAVTRALGDSYMKELVTGHPYTTETVIQPDDEFILLACDGLWDVCSDQEAVDLVRDVDDPQVASHILVDHALQRFSSDNLSIMVVRLDHAKVEKARVAKAAETVVAKQAAKVDKAEKAKTAEPTPEQPKTECQPGDEEKPPPAKKDGEKSEEKRGKGPEK